jgi:hypothetical protein
MSKFAAQKHSVSWDRTNPTLWLASDTHAFIQANCCLNTSISVLLAGGIDGEHERE